MQMEGTMKTTRGHCPTQNEYSGTKEHVRYARTGGKIKTSSWGDTKWELVSVKKEWISTRELTA